ncbi:polyprenyl synthetase family protein [Kribbella sp. CA-293567]|uniref:polyprenyl synthetase family protein n=1 Tax=Kribbella sp. CA-293567 TaxID=3002436 RepID=UPI0022DE43A0|nr:polyprenyl synthetase family protein [Kribbella sp. CA-293567]WBQ08327.1 polyprenyl synthetase family protein [Kribbella sp. CA-293567]
MADVMLNGRTHPAVAPPVELPEDEIAGLGEWLEAQVTGAKAMVSTFTVQRCSEYFTAPDTDVLRQVLREFVARGKYVRSTFAYLGWLCGRPESGAAAHAAASLELLHAFALIQDDVMDDSATRRGHPTVHVQLTDWHHRLRPGHGADRFGRSAAVLLSDLCLAWSERMLREAGLPADCLNRAWPVYDLTRSELAVGQFSDLLNDTSASPSLESVLDVARRKSGNYTVRRPLELGAALAGCSREHTAALQRYGALIGEAFQLRDDELGVFGDPRTTGKPLGDDLRQGKATSVIVMARELADPAQRAQLEELAATAETEGGGDPEWVRRWQELIVATGARARIEQLIEQRVVEATRLLRAAGLPALPRQGLLLLAEKCTRRDH